MASGYRRSMYSFNFIVSCLTAAVVTFTVGYYAADGGGTADPWQIRVSIDHPDHYLGAIETFKELASLDVMDPASVAIVNAIEEGQRPIKHLAPALTREHIDRIMVAATLQDYRRMRYDAG